MLNTKLVCTRVFLLDTRGFKQGEIYEVKNGRLILSNGDKSHTVFDCIEQINEAFYAYFKEIEEDNE